MSAIIWFKTKAKDNRILLGIIFLGLLLRILFYMQIAPWDKEVMSGKILTNDAYEYNVLASHLLHGNFDGNTFRTPGYPFFLAIIYFIFGMKPYIVIAIQIILSLINIYLTYKLAIFFFSIKGVANLGAFFMALDLHQALYSNYLITETLFLLIFLSSVYFLILFLKNPNFYRLLLSSFLLGLSVLVRPIAQYYFIIPLVLICFFGNFDFNKQRYINIILYLAIFIITLFPWQLRNYILYDRFAISSASGRVLLLDSVVATAENVTGKSAETLRNEFIEETKQKGYDSTDNPFIKNDIRMNVAISYIKQHKLAYLKRHVIGSTNVFLGLASKDIYESLGFGKGSTMSTNMFETESISNQILEFMENKSTGEIVLSIYLICYLAIVYLSLIISVIFLLLKKKYFITLILIFTIIYFAGLTGVIGLARYRVPIMPFILIGASFGLMNTIGFIKRRLLKQ